jgi:hypothetical protein
LAGFGCIPGSHKSECETGGDLDVGHPIVSCPELAAGSFSPYLLRTDDGGRTWARIGVETPPPEAIIITGVSFTDSAHGWIVASGSSTPLYGRVTTDLPGIRCLLPRSTGTSAR